MKYLFIDIRKSDEVYSKHFSQSNEYKFYNIPMNMIRFNSQTIIDHLEYIDEIYIVCQSANSSQFIKNKYFSKHDNIKVSPELQFSNLNHGNNNILINGKLLSIDIIGSNSFNFYNIMRIIQTIMGSVMLLCSLYIYIQLKDKNLLKKINILPIVILIIFGLMAIYNGLTSTCFLSIFLKDYLN
jgi:rhodanese-related sulfurtransferase